MTNLLDEEVKTLLVRRRGEWRAVAAGAGVSHSWICKFANGHIPNPGFVTLCKLKDYLTRRKSRKASLVAEMGAA